MISNIGETVSYLHYMFSCDSGSCAVKVFTNHSNLAINGHVIIKRFVIKISKAPFI